jgi:hypothetical protein
MKHSKSLKDYFGSFFNFLDLSGHICGLIWHLSFLIGVLNKLDNQDNESDYTRSKAEVMMLEAMSGSPGFQVLIAVWGLVVMTRFTDMFYLFYETRTLYMILVESFRDSATFLIIFLYNCFEFAIVS